MPKEPVTVPVPTQIYALELWRPGHLNNRNRILSLFKRDKLGTATGDDVRIINEEPITGRYYGHALHDAMVYYRGQRSDDETYEELYGMEWWRFLHVYRDHPAHGVLNSHATIRMNHDNLPESYCKAFYEYLIALNKGEGGPNDMSEGEVIRFYLRGIDDLSAEELEQMGPYHRFWVHFWTVRYDES